jgi:hypothetical protein
LYGCEAWSLTLREEHKQEIFENKAQRRIFVLKGVEIIGGQEKIHNEGLYNFHSSQILE